MPATTDTNQITKIYELRTIGYDVTHDQFNQLYKDLQLIKSAKQDLNNLKGSIIDPKELADAIARIKELETAEKNVVTAMKSGTDAADKQGGAYLALVKQYKDAKTEMQNLAAEFGVNAEETLAAAAAADVYKAKLAEITQLAKAPVIKTEVLPTVIGQGDNEASAEFLANAEKEQIATGLLANEQVALNSAIADYTEKTTQANAATAEQTEVIGVLDAALRANIASQIENETLIAENAASQKEITAAIKEQGSATDTQIEQLAALRAEQVKLIETNKALSTEIRNQAKEIIAESGSIDEAQALLNQLQQRYEALSAAEAASPFGVQLKEQIDALEPSVKDAEASLGRFSRNVGNYPQIFANAFVPLKQELDSITAKINAGNLGEAELAKLTAQQKALNEVLAVGATEFATTTAQANAYKQANIGLGLAFGTNSDTFKNFTKDIAAGSAQVNVVSDSIKAATTNSSALAGGFRSVVSTLRGIAIAIPGIGLAGLIGLLLTPLGALASKLFEVGEASAAASGSIKDLQQKTNIINQSFEAVKDKVSATVANISELTTQIDLAKNGFANKDVVLKNYNTTLGESIGKAKNLDEAEAAIVKNGPAFIQIALLKAAATQAQSKAAEKLVEATIQSQKELKEFSSVADTKINVGGFGGGTGNFNAQLDAFQDQQIKIAEANRQKKIVEIKNNEAKQFDDVAKALIDKAKAIAAANPDISIIPDTTKATKEHADKLNVAEQNALKLVDANRARLLAIENTAANEIQKTRNLTAQEEIDHYTKIEKIDVDAYNAKIAIIAKNTKLNTEEQKSIAEFGEQRSQIELTTNQKIQTVRKKQFEDQNKDLEASLKTDIENIKSANAAIQNDPSLTQTDKAANQQATDNVILGLQESYYERLRAMDAAYNKETLDKAHEAALKAADQLQNDQRLIANARLKDLQNEGAANIDIIKTNYSKEITAILENDNLSVAAKKNNIDKLTKGENITILSAELDNLTKQVAEEKSQLDQGLINNDQYLATLEKQQKAAEDLAKATNTKSKNPIAALFGFDAGSVEEKGTADVLAAAYTTAKDVMNDYFNSEEDRIKSSLKLTEDRIEADRKVALNLAQSTAEQDAINKQFDLKKADAEKAAFNKTKKLKKAQAEINFATELSTIYSTAYELGPIAGPIVGALLAGLAIVRLASTLSTIDKQTYAFGGNPDMTTLRGGRVKGRTHSQGGNPFMFKGRVFEDEVDELNIIRTKNAPANKNYTISGNHTQIASMLNRLGGGHEFMPGATIKRFDFGGNLGENLQAPAFSVGLNGSLEMFATGINKLDSKTDAINDRIDRLTVVQQTSSVTDAQLKQQKQKSIAVL